MTIARLGGSVGDHVLGRGALDRLHAGRLAQVRTGARVHLDRRHVEAGVARGAREHALAGADLDQPAGAAGEIEQHARDRRLRLRQPVELGGGGQLVVGLRVVRRRGPPAAS